MKQLLICLSLFALSITSSAQVKVWDGGAGTTDWDKDDNWDPNIAPIPGDSVIISGATVVLEGINPTIKSLLLLSNANLTIEPGAKINFTGSLSYGIRAESSHVVNNGTIAILDVGDFGSSDIAIELLNGSTFDNNSNCIIVETKGWGVRLESGSILTNDGDMAIHSEGLTAISVLLSSSLMNNGNIIITEDGMSASGILVGFGSQFENTSVIDMEVFDTYSVGLWLTDGGHFINIGSVGINASSSARCISISGSTSKIDLDDGIIDVQLTNAFGIWHQAGTLTIESGAELKISGIPQTYFINMNPSAILDCHGVLDFNN